MVFLWIERASHACHLTACESSGNRVGSMETPHSPFAVPCHVSRVTCGEWVGVRAGITRATLGRSVRSVPDPCQHFCLVSIFVLAAFLPIRCVGGPWGRLRTLCGTLLWGNSWGRRAGRMATSTVPISRCRCNWSPPLPEIQASQVESPILEWKLTLVGVTYAAILDTVPIPPLAITLSLTPLHNTAIAVDDADRLIQSTYWRSRPSC
jgi:hypothetical protein